MYIEIDFNSDEALYLQLRNQIIIGIATSQFQEGDTLPSVGGYDWHQYAYREQGIFCAQAGGLCQSGQAQRCRNCTGYRQNTGIKGTKT